MVIKAAAPKLWNVYIRSTFDKETDNKIIISIILIIFDFSLDRTQVGCNVSFVEWINKEANGIHIKKSHSSIGRLTIL